MDHRSLGRTGISVSNLGFGGSPLGGSFGAVDEREAIRAVHVAIDRGINLFDVSPYYGQTRAESVLGKALSEVDRDRFVLATKAGRYGVADFDFTESRIVQSVEESLDRLQVESLDILQCHDIEFVPIEQILNEALPAMRRLQTQGKVRFIGVTGLPLRIYRDVLAQTDLDVILSYCHYTLFDSALLELVPFLESRGVGIMNAAPFAMGLLSERPLPPWHPAPTALRDECSRAANLWRERGFDIAEIALRYSVAEPRIASTFVGMATVDDVVRNVSWVEKPPDPELFDEARATLSAVRGITWPSGIPESRLPMG